MRPARPILVLLLLMVLGIGVSGCAQVEEPPATDPATTQPVTPGGPGLQATPDAEVEIRNQTFVPERVVVDVGGTVSWTNSDVEIHTVTGQNGLTSPALRQGQVYTHQFTEPGEFSYGCSIHPQMRGVVVVR